MLNIFTVVVAYSITCPIIVPFGESSLRHNQGCTLSDWEGELSPTTSGHLLEQAETWDSVSAGWEVSGQGAEVA